jgi:hypothetical protein
MTSWEYCEAVWNPATVTLTMCAADGNHTVTYPQAVHCNTVLARLGRDGWELAGTLGSPTGVHEYFFYFKRPVPQAPSPVRPAERN